MHKWFKESYSRALFSRCCLNLKCGDWLFNERRWSNKFLKSDFESQISNRISLLSTVIHVLVIIVSFIPNAASIQLRYFANYTFTYILNRHLPTRTYQTRESPMLRRLALKLKAADGMQYGLNVCKFLRGKQIFTETGMR